MDSFGYWDCYASSSAGHRRQRHFYNDEQLSILDAEFELDPFPNRENRQRIARRLNVPDKSVMWWFQNRRRRVRQQKPSSNGLVIRNQRRQNRQTAGSNPYQTYSPPVADNRQSDWKVPSSGYFQQQSVGYQQQYQTGDWNGSGWSSSTPVCQQQVAATNVYQPPSTLELTTGNDVVNTTEYYDGQESSVSSNVDDPYVQRQNSYPYQYYDCSYYPYSTVPPYNYYAGQECSNNYQSQTYC